MLTLTIQDLSMMKNELYEAYTDVFNNSLNLLQRTIRIKLKALRFCQRFMRQDENLNKSQMIKDFASKFN